MTEIRLYASHPDHKRFDLLQRDLVIAMNPQMFFSIYKDAPEEVPEAERLATVELIKDNIEKEMDEYEFLPPNIAEVVNELERKMKEVDDEMSDV